MNTESTIALDCMGGDFGITVVVPAALKALAKYPELSVILVGDEAAIDAELQKQKESITAVFEITSLTSQKDQ